MYKHFNFIPQNFGPPLGYQATAPELVEKTSSIPSTPTLTFNGMTLPSDIITKFINAARTNSDRNIETCGFLFGIPESSAYKVSHLLIPNQTGTADTLEFFE